MLPNLQEHKNDEWCVLRREIGSETFILICQNRDSFELLPEEVGAWFRVLKVPELKAQSLMDYVWGFYGARFYFKTSQLEPLSQEQAELFGGASRQVIF